MKREEKHSSEKRLIDADALLNEFLNRYTERERNRNIVFAACEIKQDFANMISDFPTVDAVEVVRCLECKHLMFSDCYGECGKGHMGVVRPDDFCSRGERKEGAD